MPPFSDFHLFPVLVSTFVASALGALWYSPVLFGQAWLSAIGKTEDELGPAGPAIAGSTASCLVAAFSVEYLVRAAGAFSILKGLTVGALVGLGITAMAMLSDALFSGWGMRLYVIQAGYRVTYLLLMGAICGGWPR